MILGWVWWEVAAASGIVLVGSLVHGAVGMGLGLVSVPILLLIDPVFVPGPMLGSALLLSLLMIVRERSAVDVLGLKWALLGRVVGTAIAALLLVQLPTDAISVTAALMVLIAVGLSVSGLRARPEKGVLVGMGTASGIMSTLSSVGGPPIALIYQHAKGPRLRATMSGFFIVGTVISLAGLIAVGSFGWAELKATVVLVPAVVVGYLVSGYALPVLDRGHTRDAVLLVSAVSSVVLLVRTLG